MRRFALTMTSKGQVTLPADYRRSIGIGPDDRLSLLLDDEGRATLTKASGDLMGLQSGARTARKNAVEPDPGTDPVGDYLIGNLNRQAGATTTVTFDTRAARHPAFLRLAT